MIVAEVGQYLTLVTLRIGRNGNELDFVAKRGWIDQRLNFRNPFSMERTDVGAVSVDEVQDNDFAAKIAHLKYAATSVLKTEVGRLFVNRLEILFFGDELLLDLGKRQREGRFRGNGQE